MLITILLMAAGVFLLMFSFHWNMNCLGNLSRNRHARTALGGSLFAIVLIFSNPMTSGWVASAFRQGSTWSSPFVMHIPNALDFATFIGQFFSAWPRIEMMSEWGYVLLACAIGIFTLYVFVWLSRKKKGEIYYEDDGSNGLRLTATTFLLTFAAMFLGTFLTAYFIGTLMWFGDYWWVVILLILGGAGGTGVQVYDRNGRHVGTLYD